MKNNGKVTSSYGLMRQMKENLIAPRLEMDGLKFSFAFSIIPFCNYLDRESIQ